MIFVRKAEESPVSVTLYKQLNAAMMFEAESSDLWQVVKINRLVLIDFKSLSLFVLEKFNFFLFFATEKCIS